MGFTKKNRTWGIYSSISLGHVTGTLMVLQDMHLFYVFISSYYFDRRELAAFPLLIWWPKSLLAKVVKFSSLLAMIVTSAQMGVVGLIMRGEHIFPMIGIANTHAGFYSVRENIYGPMISRWLTITFRSHF
ncbi:hypothetical protein HA466_0232100 [Hirschfeldia incana]|nr:hypothetical protein HA466_0232100 [Hirschfeldia incana]KAJ0239599.1 hypothetical protein HA466_0232100 [Hirschfeldia incana]KAJ0239600.1 hypothetical protein HA466_0232100 [Hirschfeldia incana]KAJ0239601.1 hypothetical protein HA466_0232100 [Hirschfeldia incana]KAJ0239602.1 hypothetical protein HA466_0232100 [Hirschfeldia incana]